MHFRKALLIFETENRTIAVGILSRMVFTPALLLPLLYLYSLNKSSVADGSSYVIASKPSDLRHRPGLHRYRLSRHVRSFRLLTTCSDPLPRSGSPPALTLVSFDFSVLNFMISTLSQQAQVSLFRRG